MPTYVLQTTLNKSCKMNQNDKENFENKKCKKRINKNLRCKFVSLPEALHYSFLLQQQITAFADVYAHRDCE